MQEIDFSKDLSELKSLKALHSQIKTDEDLAATYAMANSKYWEMEDSLYDYELGSDEYNLMYEIVRGWNELVNNLSSRIIDRAVADGFAIKAVSDYDDALATFMEKMGYENTGGEWVK